MHIRVTVVYVSVHFFLIFVSDAILTAVLHFSC